MKYLHLYPDRAGVVYSPGGSGWAFYPEELLFVGFTGTPEAMTIVRSKLAFVLAELPPEAILTRAVLHLDLIRNEPPETPKILCLREAPHAEPWRREEEEAQLVFREEHFGTPTGIAVDLDLTDRVESWRRGAPNNGILLGLTERVPGLLAFANPTEGPGRPVLSLCWVRQATNGRTVMIDLNPDAVAEAEEFPPGEVLVENQGPGFVWITPLYRFERWRPLTPEDVRTEVIGAGERMVLEPKWDASAITFRAAAANAPARVRAFPLA